MSDLYKSNDFDTWKKVLDENMSYHNGEEGPTENIFDNTVLNAFKYFKDVKTVLDVGSGWGGPARILKNHLGLQVTCLTNGEAGQIDILQKDFEVLYQDANAWDSNRQWDMVVFFESFCHMKNETFGKFAKNANKILIKDCVHGSLVKDQYDKNWEMNFRSKDTWYKIIEKEGFLIKDFIINQKESYISYNSAIFWLNNILRYEKEERRLVTGQIKKLKYLCLATIDNSHKLRKPKAFYCTIYAEKK